MSLVFHFEFHGKHYYHTFTCILKSLTRLWFNYTDFKSFPRLIQILPSAPVNVAEKNILNHDKYSCFKMKSNSHITYWLKIS